MADELRTWKADSRQEVTKAMRRRKIQDTGDTIRSVESDLQIGQQEATAEMAVDIVGLFVDMGVGRGVDADEVSIQRTLGGGRRPRRFLKKMSAQTYRAADLYTEQIADRTADGLADALPREVEL